MYQTSLKARGFSRELFTADTLSEQNCRQLEEWGVKYLILRNNQDSVNDFRKILAGLDIPFYV